MNNEIYLKQIINAIGNGTKDTDNVEGDITLNDFISRKKIMSVIISEVDEEGNLYGYFNNGYKGMINYEDFLTEFAYKYRTKYIGKKYSVIAKSYSSKDRVVFLSKKEADTIIRKKVQDTIKASLEKKKQPIMDAYVKGYNAQKKIIKVDILGTGVIAEMRFDEWSFAYVDDIIESIKGTMKKPIKIRILRYINNWISCSRKRVYKNPWTDIEEKLPIGTEVTVKCIHKFTSYFFGEIIENGRADIIATCTYPKSFRLPIIKGLKYSGTINNIDQEKEAIVIKIKNVVDADLSKNHLKINMDRI